MIVYVAGPYTLGDPAVNVRNAMIVGDRIIDAGHSPYVPHLSHFMHIRNPRDYHDWIRISMDFVRISGALIRLPGKSPGADNEISLAESLRIQVFYDVDLLLKFLAHYDQEMNNAPRS